MNVISSLPIVIFVVVVCLFCFFDLLLKTWKSAVCVNSQESCSTIMWDRWLVKKSKSM